MKKKDLLSLRQKGIDELKKLVASKRNEFYKSHAQMKSSGEKNLKKPKNLRHEISQILTIIREKEIVAEIGKEEETKKKINQKEEKQKKLAK